MNIREKLARRLADNDLFRWDDLTADNQEHYRNKADQQIAIFKEMLDTMEKEIPPYESDEFCVDWENNFLATSMADAYRRGEAHATKALKILLEEK